MNCFAADQKVGGYAFTVVKQFQICLLSFRIKGVPSVVKYSMKQSLRHLAVMNYNFLSIYTLLISATTSSDHYQVLP